MRSAAVVVLLLSAGLASAQVRRPQTPAGGEPPTSGVRLDVPSLAGDGDASGVEVNPASLGLLDSWALLLRHAEMPGRLAGRGDALLAALPLPYLRSFVVGAGLQWLRPSDAMGYSQSVKLSLALAWRFRRLLSLGLGYHAFIADHDGALDGMQALDVGLAIHPLEWLGGGLVVRNLNTPVYDGLPLQRVYDLELVGRPLATRRLELGAGLRLGERRGELDPYFRLEGELVQGLRLFSGVELVSRDFHRTGTDELDVRVVLGLDVSLEQVGLAFSTTLARELEPRVGPLSGSTERGVFQGAGVTLRLQGERRAPLVTFKKRLLQVELEGSLSEERWAKLVGLLRDLEPRPDVQGVLLHIDGLECGWGQAQEIRGWLKRLRRAGKSSIAYLRAPGAREYYVAAAADRVLLDPGGGVQLKGLAVRTLHLRGLFDKVGVSAQFVRIAEFKSAPEAFTHRTGSPAAREMQESLLDDLFQQVLHDLAADRKLTAARVREVIDEGPFIPPHALQAGLVDQLVGPDELATVVERQSGASLVKARDLVRQPPRWPVGPAVAVILVEGDIVRGKSMTVPLLDKKLVGDQTIAEALAWARGAGEVKAVVLRINSPGGSAMASDRIWREVKLTRKAKPLVVSMGDLATSGGYFAACSGERIFAEPGTLTGSIGIFTGKFDLSGLMGHLGLSFDTAARGKRALLDEFDRPFSDEERSFVLSRLQHYYRAFLAAVGGGRRLTLDQVHRVARGRVWTGRQAAERGLVDRHGGLIDAIDEAQQRAGLGLSRPVRLLVRPEEKPGLLGQLLSLVAAAPPPLVLPAAARDLLRGIPAVLLRARSGEALARLPYEVRFAD